MPIFKFRVVAVLDRQAVIRKRSFQIGSAVSAVDFALPGDRIVWQRIAAAVLKKPDLVAQLSQPQQIIEMVPSHSAQRESDDVSADDDGQRTLHGNGSADTPLTPLSPPSSLFSPHRSNPPPAAM